jgi:hypothetical protein
VEQACSPCGAVEPARVSLHESRGMASHCICFERDVDAFRRQFVWCALPVVRCLGAYLAACAGAPVSCTPIANRQPPTASTLVWSALCLLPASCWGCLQARCRDLMLLRSNGDRWKVGLVHAAVCLFVRSALGAWCCFLWCCFLVVCWRSASWVLVCGYVVRVEVSSPVTPFLWPPHVFFAFGVRTTGKYHEPGRDVKAGSLSGCLDLPCPARGMLVVPHPKAKNIPAFMLLTFERVRASNTLLISFVCRVAGLRGRKASNTRPSIYMWFLFLVSFCLFCLLSSRD